MTRWIAFVFCVSAGYCGSATAAHYDVFLLGGQSNANGRGDTTEIPTGSLLADPQTDVRFYYHKTQNATNNVLPTDQFIDLAPGSGFGTAAPVHTSEFGAELGLGRTLADAYPDRNTLIIKYTDGGTNLHTQWAEGGSRYTTFVDTVQTALGKLDDVGDSYTMQGMVWLQGESDAGNTTNANAYQVNLVDLIDRVRTDLFDGADAPFVLTRLSDNQYSGSLSAGVLAVRAAQTNVSTLLANVATIDTDDDALFTSYATAPIHFDANGQINIGNALGQQFVSLSVPEPNSAACLLGIVVTLILLSRYRRPPVPEKDCGLRIVD